MDCISKFQRETININVLFSVLISIFLLYLLSVYPPWWHLFFLEKKHFAIGVNLATIFAGLQTTWTSWERVTVNRDHFVLRKNAQTRRNVYNSSLVKMREKRRSRGTRQKKNGQMVKNQSQKEPDCYWHFHQCRHFLPLGEKLYKLWEIKCRYSDNP